MWRPGPWKSPVGVPVIHQRRGVHCSLSVPTSLRFSPVCASTDKRILAPMWKKVNKMIKQFCCLGFLNKKDYLLISKPHLWIFWTWHSPATMCGSIKSQRHKYNAAFPFSAKRQHALWITSFFRILFLTLCPSFLLQNLSCLSSWEQHFRFQALDITYLGGFWFRSWLLPIHWNKWTKKGTAFQ